MGQLDSSRPTRMVNGTTPFQPRLQGTGLDGNNILLYYGSIPPPAVDRFLLVRLSQASNVVLFHKDRIPEHFGLQMWLFLFESTRGRLITVDSVGPSRLLSMSDRVT